MDSNFKMVKLLNKIFWLLIVIIILSIVYQVIEPKITNMYKDKESKSVTDSLVINELQECISKYFDAINNKQFDRANMMCKYLNKKDHLQIIEVYDKMKVDYPYKIIVKYAYNIISDTYRCYFLIQNIENESYEFMTKNDKTLMYEVVIRLDLKSSSFKIIYDNFI